MRADKSKLLSKAGLQQDAPLQQQRFEQPTAHQKELGLWVHAAGFDSATKPHPPWSRVLGEYAGVYVSRGRGWFESPPTGRLDVKTGTFFWLFPTVPHSYTPVDGTWAEQWFIFHGSMAEEFERQGYMIPSRPFVQVGEDQEIINLFSRLEKVFLSSGPLSMPLASAIAHELIVTVHGIATGFIGTSAGMADPTVAEAVRIIEQEALLGLQPDAIAARLHVGYSTLRRRFRQKTGYAIKEYILRVQLNRAKELLAFTRLSVEQVAAEVGFEDSFYFSRLFSEREGVPPSEFREHQSRMPEKNQLPTNLHT